MIKMSSSHNAEEILDICIESIGGNDIKSNFRLLRDQIISHYDQYEIAAANLSFFRISKYDQLEDEVILHQEDRSRFSLTKKDILDLYRNQMLIKKKPARVYYDKIINSAPNGKCPLCGSLGQADSIDHYLPKSLYPFYVIYPNNLIPACDRCNKLKSDKVSENEDNQTLHPYFDQAKFYEQQWIKACISQNDNFPLSLYFWVEPPDFWSDSEASRVRNHFTTFNLNKRFSIEAAQRLATLRPILQGFIGLPEFGLIVKAYLQGEAESWKKEVSINCWQHVFYSSLANNDWFCNEGFML